MTTVRPFPASVVSPAWAERVVAPMHDTLPHEVRAAILATEPFSFLHVTRAPEDGEDPDAVVRDNAKALERLIGAGAFSPTAAPALYLYRLGARGHAQTGIVAELAMEDFAADRVRGHEGIRPDRVDALVRHFTSVPARSDLVALMHHPDAEIAAAVAAGTAGDPILDLVVDEGVRHTVWRLDDPDRMSAISRRLDPQILYITDGHHRVAASLELWERGGSPPGHGVLSVLFPSDQLCVLAFHRRIVGPLDPATIERIEEHAALEPIDGPHVEPGSFALYLDRRWLRVVPLDRPEAPGRDGLDVTWLHDRMLEPVFGIREADDVRLELATELVPVSELTGRCDADGGALFLLHAPGLDRLVEVADRHEVIPPKATFFDPKPASGVLLQAGPDRGFASAVR